MNPRDFPFWENESKEFWDTVEALVLAALAAGILGGERLVPEDYLDEVSPELLEEKILEFMAQYNMDVWSNISITSMTMTLAIIEEWKDSGLPIDYLEQELRDRVFSRNRADMISISEVTRLFAEGNEILWGATGLIFAKVWQTSRDERVCPVCAPLHGQIRFISSEFTAGIKNPPAHPRCRCWIRPALWEGVLAGKVVGVLNK